jgi:hypothetical protein
MSDVQDRAVEYVQLIRLRAETAAEILKDHFNADGQKAALAMMQLIGELVDLLEGELAELDVVEDEAL